MNIIWDEPARAFFLHMSWPCTLHALTERCVDVYVHATSHVMTDRDNTIRLKAGRGQMVYSSEWLWLPSGTDSTFTFTFAKSLDVIFSSHGDTAAREWDAPDAWIVLLARLCSLSLSLSLLYCYHPDALSGTKIWRRLILRESVLGSADVIHLVPTLNAVSSLIQVCEIKKQWWKSCFSALLADIFSCKCSLSDFSVCRMGALRTVELF